MNSLPAPDVSKVSTVYDEIASSRAKISSVVRRDRSKLNGSFNGYQGIITSPVLPTSLYANSVTEKRLFENLYLRPPAGADILKAHALPAKFFVCPYCGGRAPSTIDHYLEKALFPEFSLYPENLVPSCRGCNRSQSAIKNNRCDKLHPYFSPVLSRLQLKCSITIRHVTPHFDLQLHCPNMSANEIDHSKRHRAYIRLERRFARYASREWDDCREVLRESDGPFAQQYIMRVANAERLIYGNNSWRYLFYDGVGNCVPAIDILRA